jgi:hypothetical protein
LLGSGVAPGLVATALIAHLLAWLAGEKWFMAGRRLSFGWSAAGAALVREALAPVLAMCAIGGRRIPWRGTDLGGEWRSRGKSASRTSV